MMVGSSKETQLLVIKHCPSVIHKRKKHKQETRQGSCNKSFCQTIIRISEKNKDISIFQQDTTPEFSTDLIKIGKVLSKKAACSRKIDIRKIGEKEGRPPLTISTIVQADLVSSIVVLFGSILSNGQVNSEIPIDFLLIQIQQF